MDWGCQFFTPERIAQDLSGYIVKSDLIVDLFAGSGKLHHPIIELSGNKIDVLALDIDPTLPKNLKNFRVKHLTADCLDPRVVSHYLAPYKKSKTTFVLNPPFCSLNRELEVYYWSRISLEPPKKLTFRVECIALASAITAAAVGSQILAIIPETLIRSERLAFFFETLKKSFNMKVLSVFRRDRFGGAEVDVAIISLEKRYKSCLVSLLNADDSDLLHGSSNYPFILFRGKVVPPSDRTTQISVKDLKLGGTEISVMDQNIPKESRKAVFGGDILIARVGPRMLGRVAIVKKGSFTINESVLCLRTHDIAVRAKLYNALKSKMFLNWLKLEARGTANRFIPTIKFKEWLLENI